MASGSYCGKNLTRATLGREVAELLALAFFFNEGENHPLLDLRREELVKVEKPKIVQYCPMCRRGFLEGAPICGCKATETKKSPADGKELVKCEPRVVGMINRHMLRAASAKMRSFQHKFGSVLKRKIMISATPVITGPFKTVSSRKPDALPLSLKVEQHPVVSPEPGVE